MNESTTCSLSEFALRQGFKPSYVTQLKKTDRLVLTDDGKRVMIAESIARIEETRDPSKAGVTARHAGNRPEAPPAPVLPLPVENEQLFDESGGRIESYQSSKARKEFYLAQAAKRDLQLSMGELLRAADVRHAIEAAAGQIRNRLENLPQILSPQVLDAASKGEAAVRVLLTDYVRQLLEDASRAFENASKGKSR